MGNGAVDLVHIVGYKDVAFFDGAGPAVQKLLDEAAKLANEHLSAGVCDHVELVLLFADGWAHSAPQHQSVHFASNRSESGTDEGWYQWLLVDKLLCRLFGMRLLLSWSSCLGPYQYVPHRIYLAKVARQDERV